MSEFACCGREFKNENALKAHKRLKHGEDNTSPASTPVVKVSEEVKEVPPVKEKESGVVYFSSPRSAELYVVVKQRYYEKYEVPNGGTKVILSEGKEAQFVNHEFHTDDPVIIDYLKNEYYEPRWPIVWLENGVPTTNNKPKK